MAENPSPEPTPADDPQNQALLRQSTSAVAKEAMADKSEGKPTGNTLGDQKRVATPTLAVRAGSDFLVVGRPILEAADPRAAALAILNEIRNAAGKG